MVAVSVEPFEIETTTRRGDLVRADVYLPAGRDGLVPVLLGASPYPFPGTTDFSSYLLQAQSSGA